MRNLIYEIIEMLEIECEHLDYEFEKILSYALKDKNFEASIERGFDIFISSTENESRLIKKKIANNMKLIREEYRKKTIVFEKVRSIKTY